MDEIRGRDELGKLLTRLKERSGQSYESIGRRAFASKSAVHRYCTGLSVPRDFGVIERIGFACRATRDEVSQLRTLWLYATVQDATDGATSMEASPAVSSPVPPPVGSASGATTTTVSAMEVSPRPRRRSAAQSVLHRVARPRAVLATAATALVLAFALLLTTSAPSLKDPDAIVTGPGQPQSIDGAGWTMPPLPIPHTLFGVTLNSGTGNMPSFNIGAVRLWDSGTRWAQVQPRRWDYDWSTLDRHIVGAARAGLPVLFVFGGTPAWAAANSPRTPYADGSRTAPPDRLADWDSYVRTLLKRYRGKIEGYELWALANDPRFYSGSVETLVEMTARASRIIRAEDPQAIVVCPGMGNLWTLDGQRILRRFAELGGYDHCDVAGIKLHQRTAADPPETMLELIGIVDSIFHEAGVHPRLWNTGTTYMIPLQRALDEVTARSYAVRFFLVGLYARTSNLERMYFYNWGGLKIPIVLQAEGGSPTSAARAVEVLQQWLATAEVRLCGRGPRVNLPENTLKCEITLHEGDRKLYGTILWTDVGTATIEAGWDVVSIRYLTNSRETIHRGETIAISGEPRLVIYRD
jgi:hypothetical protein